MFHSSARSTQGAQITSFKPSDGEVTIVDACPQGQARHFLLTASGKSFSWGVQMPTLGFRAFAGSGSINVFLKDKDGQLYFIAAGGVNGPVLASVATVLLAPGESVVAIPQNDGAPNPSKVYALAYYLDLQGPFAHKRTPITNDWQDIIPAPQHGKIHTPIGSFTTPITQINGYAVKKDSIGGAIVERVMADGSQFDATGGSSAAPGVIFPFATTIPTFALLQGVIPFPEGWSLQAKKGDKDGAKGAVAFASYLVTDNPKIHRHV